MKTGVFVIVLAGSAFFMNGQDLKTSMVPAAARDAFSKTHPAVKDMQWEKEDGNYEVEYKENKIEKSEVYDASGTLLATETEIKTEDLPAPVKDFISKNFAGEKIKEASQITDATGNLLYEVEVGAADYVFDSGGQLIKKEKDEGEKDDD